MMHNRISWASIRADEAVFDIGRRLAKNAYAGVADNFSESMQAFVVLHEESKALNHVDVVSQFEFPSTRNWQRHKQFGPGFRQ